MKGWRPCPFCGGEARLIYYDDGGEYTDEMLFVESVMIQCKTCGAAILADAFGDPKGTKQGLRGKWNRRVRE